MKEVQSARSRTRMAESSFVAIPFVIAFVNVQKSFEVINLFHSKNYVKSHAILGEFHSDLIGNLTI